MLKFLVEKEFRQIRRNKFLPRMVVGMPIVALLLFPLVANFAIQDLRVSVVDTDHSGYSARLIHKLEASDYFILYSVSSDYEQALREVEQDKSDLILTLPPNFEKDLMREQSSEVLVAANAVNGMKGGLGSMYLNSIVADFSRELREELLPPNMSASSSGFEIVPSFQFNPYLEYKYTMIPAIMLMMLGMISGFLPALNIVNEKEKGTIEQMNVTPVSRFQLILSKLIPYWIIGFVVLTLSFLIAWIFYGMVSVGSYGTIYLLSAIFVLAFSGFGLTISNYASTIQQAMFMMFFFVVTFIFLSGLYTPVSSMPEWTQWVSRFSPLRYMVEVLRAVYLKGSTFGELTTQFWALFGFAVFFNGWAVLSYRKTE